MYSINIKRDITCEDKLSKVSMINVTVYLTPALVEFPRIKNENLACRKCLGTPSHLE